MCGCGIHHVIFSQVIPFVPQFAPCRHATSKLVQGWWEGEGGGVGGRALGVSLELNLIKDTVKLHPKATEATEGCLTQELFSPTYTDLTSFEGRFCHKYTAIRVWDSYHAQLLQEKYTSG